MTTATHTMNTLYQSRNGGKIHTQGCGHRSLYIHPVKNTQGITRQQAVEKYGKELCRHCFPEVEAMPTAPAKPATNHCTGSNTWDWANGTHTPERKGYAASNGGICGHCNNWAGTTTPYSSEIRKHKAK